MSNSYNQYNTTSQGGQMVNGPVNRGFFSRILKDLSNFGMDYQSMVQNSYGIGAYEDGKEMTSSSSGYYDIFTKKVISKILSFKSIAYLDRTYDDKRKILRQYSIKDEIKDFLEIVCNETVMYDDDNYFCKVADLPSEFAEVVRQKYQQNFNKVYQALGFDDGNTAWYYLKNL
jgi:hypothetical protein